MRNARPTPPHRRLLTAILFCFALGNLVQAGTLGPLTYQVNGDAITITDCDTSVTNVVVPAMIESKPVARITNNAFRDCSLLMSVTLPSSIASIDSLAFSNCKSLQSMTIPAGVNWVDPNAFTLCSKLSAINVDAGNLDYTSSNGVLFDAAQTELYKYPEGKPDTTYTVPASVGIIYSTAFNHCTSLTGITIPAGVFRIDRNPFAQCRALLSIDVDAGNLNYSSADGILYTASQDMLMAYPGGKVGYYTFPATVTRMDSSAFYKSVGLTGILLPQWQISLPFSGCTNLMAIDVEAEHPEYSSLDGVVFNTNRTELIKFPEGKPGPYSVPAGVTDIGYNAFRECNVLFEITFSSSVTNISRYAFSYCTSLTNITIPAEISTIGDSAFGGCSKVLSFAVEAGNPNFSSVDGVLFNADQTELVAHPGGRTGHYTIPNGVTTIGYDAFLSNAVSSVTIPPGVTTLRQGAFSRCLLLTEITLPESMTTIGRYAFDWCTSLTNITIPSGVTDIEYFAFENCTQLRNATFLGDAPYLGDPYSSFTFRTFDHTAVGFTIHYLSSNTGFTSLPWSGYPVTSWFMDNGMDPVAADLDQDVNGDGVTLLTAYALNLDPIPNLSGSLPQAVLASNAMSMVYFAASPGVTYTVETSTNLVDWTDTGVSLSGLDGNNEVTATIDTTVPHRFLRLRVEK